MLTACGIETPAMAIILPLRLVATVLTACGIETQLQTKMLIQSLIQLQQCLPLAVLILSYPMNDSRSLDVATVLTTCGIETLRCHHQYRPSM